MSLAAKSNEEIIAYFKELPIRIRDLALVCHEPTKRAKTLHEELTGSLDLYPDTEVFVDILKDYPKYNELTTLIVYIKDILENFYENLELHNRYYNNSNYHFSEGERKIIDENLAVTGKFIDFVTKKIFDDFATPNYETSETYATREEMIYANMLKHEHVMEDDDTLIVLEMNNSASSIYNTALGKIRSEQKISTMTDENQIEFIFGQLEKWHTYLDSMSITKEMHMPQTVREFEKEITRKEKEQEQLITTEQYYEEIKE